MTRPTPALIAGFLAAALAVPGTAAPRFERLHPETRIGKLILPEGRLIEDAPFDPGGSSVDASLNRDGKKLWLSANGQNTRRLSIRIHRAAFPDAASLKASFGEDPQFPLSSKPLGDAVYTREILARSSMVKTWRKNLEQAARNPAKLIQSWALKNAQRQKRRYLNYGYRNDVVKTQRHQANGVTHFMQGAMRGNWYVNRNDDPLQPKGYGSTHDGWRPQPWVALRPTYQMQARFEVTLPGPGAYVVVAEGDQGKSFAPFLYSELEAVVRRDEDETLLRATRRRDGNAAEGVTAAAYWLDHQGKKKYSVVREVLSVSKAGKAEFRVPYGTDNGWVVLKKGPHVRVISCSGSRGKQPASLHVGKRRGRSMPGFFPGHRPSRGAGSLHLTTDRPIYKPGDTIHFRGVARKLHEGVDFGVLAHKEGSVKIGWGNGPKAAVKTDDLGVFHGSLELAKDQRTGQFQLQANVAGANASLPIRIEAYRKPEHEVLVQALRPWTAQGDAGKFELKGRFTVGGALSKAKVRWRIRSVSPAQSSFEGRIRGWCGGHGWSWRPSGPSPTGHLDESGEAELDDQGKWIVPVKLPAVETDYAVRLEATVVSPDGREVHGNGTFYAPRAAIVAALRSTMGLLEKGEAWRVRGVLKDMEGKPSSGTVKLQMVRHRWERSETGSWTHHEDKLKTWSEEIPAGGQADWEIPVEKSGNIQLTVTAQDARGRETTARVSTYRFGPDAPGYRGDQIEATPDQESYAPGETATVLIRVPIEKGTLWWSLEGEHIRRHGGVPFTGFNALVKVPLTADSMPEAKLHLETFKDGRRISKDVNLEVPATHKMAEFSLATQARVMEPGGDVAVELVLKDEAGRPLVGDVSLAVFDEALLQLAPDRTPNPYEHFYGRRQNRVQAFETWQSQYGLRNNRRREKRMAMKSMGAGSRQVAGLMAPSPSAPEMDSFAGDLAEGSDDGAPMDKESNAAPAIKIRSDFRDLAHWTGSVRTNAKGHATVRFKLPDDLARWRLVAYAVDAETRVGKATGRVIARKDLMVRMGLPRFLTTGDHIVLKASVQNIGDAASTGKLSFKADGARAVPLGKRDLDRLDLRLDPKTGWLLSPTGPVRKAPDEYQLTIQAKSHKAVDFPLYVYDYPVSGEVAFTSVFDSQGRGDGMKKAIPVVPFARKKTEVTVHPLKGKRTVEVKARKGTFSAATKVSLDLMLDLDQAAHTVLVDDLEKLLDYRYGCTEQTLSKFVPLAIAKGHLGEKWLKQAGLDADLDEVLEAGVERLKQLRRGDGWGWAPGAQASSSVTAYLISRIFRLPPKIRDKLVKDLDIFRAVRWLQKIYKANGKAALSQEETGNPQFRRLVVYRAFEALSLAGAAMEMIPAPSGKDVGSPRFWACYGTAAVHQGKPKLAARAFAALQKGSIGNGAFHTWRHTGSRWSWYGDDAETTGLVLEFLADLSVKEPSAVGASTLAQVSEGGLRWLVQGEGASRYRSTKARAVSVGLCALRLWEKDGTLSREAAEVVVRAGREQRATVSPDPRAKRPRVYVTGPELARSGSKIDLEKKSGPDVFVRQDTTYFYKGPFKAEDNGFRVTSNLILDGKEHPSHELMKRVVEVEVRESRTYAMLEVPLLSGGEVKTQGDDRPTLERKDSEGKWRRSWPDVDVLDDRVVYYFQYLSPGSYRATVPITPEIAGHHNMVPARMFLMYFPHFDGTSQSHRVSIKRGERGK